MLPPLDAEWLETDGLGGYASGTVGGARTRRYHALLLSALTPPTGRRVLVPGLDLYLETQRGRYALSTQHYAPGVDAPDGLTRLVDFGSEPWPTWTYRVEGKEVKVELFLPHERGVAILQVHAGIAAKLIARPFLADRDYHGLDRENPAFRFDAEHDGAAVIFRPYGGATIALSSNGRYRAAPHWYRQFLYREEARRGLDALEDLASPGELEFDLPGSAVLILGRAPIAVPTAYAALALSAERGRRLGLGPRRRAAHQFFVRRGEGRTIIAGYPWFTDWGRDTFIAVRGLASNPLDLGIAEEILGAWCGHVSEGMLPNVFPDGSGPPEYNSVDASLWYVVAVHELFERAKRAGRTVPRAAAMQGAINAILTGYRDGTRFGIKQSADGLLAAGAPGVQLTWMDAKVQGHVVTPRIGKPVEIQALWINALKIGASFDARWASLAAKAEASFEPRFWLEEEGYLADVVDVDHVAGAIDAKLRPNQIFAVAGLPFSLLTKARAERVIAAVESVLLTPVGLRTLSPADPAYRPRYEGDAWSRDTAYHQGTVWPWLLAAFVEAWLDAHGDVATARARFLEPLLAHLGVAGLGHVSEIFDGDSPHRPAGCPFQAWSMGALLRLEQRLAIASKLSG